VLISLVAQFCAITLFAHYWMDVSNYSLTAKAQLLQQTNPTTISTNHWHYHSFALTILFQLQVIINAARKDRDRWLKTMPYIASDPWRWSTKEIPITSSIHVFINYSKTSINSTVLSMLHHKANDHSYSHRAFIRSVYSVDILFTLTLFDILFTLPIFEIRVFTSLPEYTVRENDNYFVIHSSSLHLQGRYFLVTTHLICKFRSINL